MSGYVGNDGSQLAGGLNPSGMVQGIGVNSLGQQIVEANIQSWVRGGQGFFANAGLISGGASTPGANWFSSALFNPASSGKSLLVYSCMPSNTGGGAYIDLVQVTANPALGTNASIFNSKFGGPASTLAAGNVTYTAAGAGMTYPGGVTQIGTYEIGQSLQDILAGSPLVLPAGSAFGLQLLMYVNNAQKFSTVWRWIEF